MLYFALFHRTHSPCGTLLAFGDDQVGLWNPRASPHWFTDRAGWPLCPEPHGLTGHRENGDCLRGGLGNVGGREETTWGVPPPHSSSTICQKWHSWLNVTQSCTVLCPDPGAILTESTLPHAFSVGSALTHYRDGHRELGECMSALLHHSLVSLLELLHQSGQNRWVLLTWALYLMPKVISEGLG